MQTTSALDILVVDDDEPLRDMLTRSFEREGHRVTAVPDGTAGLGRAGEGDFDGVLRAGRRGGPPSQTVGRRARAPPSRTPTSCSSTSPGAPGRPATTSPTGCAPAALSCRS